MTVSIRAAKNVTVRRFAKAAVVAAFLSTLGATQGMGDMPMPENCDKYLQQCSLRVWSRDSFPHAGDTRSVTFSNGRTLTCTSKGRDKPRDCKITPTPEQCAKLKEEVRSLKKGRDYVNKSIGGEQALVARAMKMTKAQLDAEIARLQRSVDQSKSQPFHMGGSPFQHQQEDMEKTVLNFLIDLRRNQELGPEFGEKPERMQATANQIANDLKTWANGEQQEYEEDIKKVGDQMANLGCANVPSADE